MKIRNMSKEEILLKLCETLTKDGFKHFSIEKDWWKDKNNREFAIDNNMHYSLIFSEEFAKFIWGQYDYKENEEETMKTWKLGLLNLSQSEDRLGFLWKEILSKV